MEYEIDSRLKFEISELSKKLSSIKNVNQEEITNYIIFLIKEKKETPDYLWFYEQCEKFKRNKEFNWDDLGKELEVFKKNNIPTNYKFDRDLANER